MKFVENCFVLLYTYYMQNSKNNIHANHRTRLKQKFIQHGVNGIAEHEAIELLLFFAIKRKDVNPLAHSLCSRFKNIEGILNASKEELLLVDGVGERTARLIVSFGKLASNYLSNKTKARQIISSAMAKSFALTSILPKPKEEFYVACLDGFLNVLALKLLEEGNKSNIKMDINKITQFALDANASKIIIIHTHPSGEPSPSENDIVFTHSVVTSCFFNDIDLLDHIIIGDKTAFSFVENNLLQTIKLSAYNTIPGTDKNKKVADFDSPVYINSRKQSF